MPKRSSKEVDRILERILDIFEEADAGLSEEEKLVRHQRFVKAAKDAVGRRAGAAKHPRKLASQASARAR